MPVLACTGVAAMSSNAEELRRVLHGPSEGERPDECGTEAFLVRCPGDALAVLTRAKEVLAAVLIGSSDATWPTPATWSALLPQWFVDACAPEESREEAERFLQYYRNLPPEQRAQIQQTERWSLADWLYWMEPGNRQWWWWKGFVEDSDTCVAEVVVQDRPFAAGAVRWLFRASGARLVEGSNL